MDSDQPEPFDLHEIWRNVLRGWPIIVACAAALTLLLGLTGISAPSVPQTASGQIEYVVPGRTAPANVPAPAIPDEILVFSSDTLKSAASKLFTKALKAPTALPAIVAVQTPAANSVDLTATGPNAALAINAYMDAYVSQRAAVLQKFFATNRELAVKSIDEATAAKDQARSDLSNLTEASPATAALTATIATYDTQIKAGGDAIAAIDAAKDVKPALISRKAVAAANPGSGGVATLKRVITKSITGGILGLMLGGGIVIGLQMLRGRIYNRRRLAQALPGIPILGEVPAHPRKESSLVAMSDPSGKEAESFRSIRAGLEASRYLFVQALGAATQLAIQSATQSTAQSAANSPSQSGSQSGSQSASQSGMSDDRKTGKPQALQSFLFASPIGVNAAATVASNLAYIWAQTGTRTHLIDADLRTSAVSKATNSKPDGPGIEGLLAGTSGIISMPKAPNLHVVPAVGNTPNASELLARAPMGELIQSGNAKGAVTFIATSGVLDNADAATLAPLVDGIILICTAGRTSRRELTAAAERLINLGTPIVGAILTNVAPGDRY
jgi:protein-tyrosine kinase